MKKPKMFYFEKEDILHLVMQDEEEASSVELSPNITAHGWCPRLIVCSGN
jgi:hypothetical protein